MDRNWWKRLENNKALQLFKKYLHTIINKINEKDIENHIYKKGINIDEILIEESSKEIDNSTFKLKLKKKKNQNNNNENENKRNINVLYMCLLKFNGLLRYMYFNGLNYEDIFKISHFIKHTFRKKGEYVFRQFDKSNALYGVIKGKAVVRLVDFIDYTKKFMNEININNFSPYINENINVQYFMSDCEEEVEEKNDEEEEEEDDDYSFDEEKNNLDNFNLNLRKVKFKNNTILPFKISDNVNNKLIIRKDFKSKTKIHKIKNITEQNKNFLNKNNIEKDIKKEENKKEIKKKKIKKNKKSKKLDYIDLFAPIKPKKKKEEKKKKEKKKEIKIIKSKTKFQTPNEPLEGEILNNFIKEFEYENFSLSNGMCFGEWGLLYSIPRSTSIYAKEDTDFFYLEKEFFDKILLSKFLKNDKKKIQFLTHKFPIFKKDFKIRHIFTKIIPMFVNKDNIIYTPFDNAENIYLLYQGEGLLFNIPNAKEKDDYYIKRNNYQIISRLQEGAISGIESCLNHINKKYDYGFLITRNFTTLLKINIKFISNLYKDFCKSLIPLYQNQKELYQNIKLTSHKFKDFKKLKKKLSLSQIVNNVLYENQKKKRIYSNDFKYNEKIINFNNNNQYNRKLNIKLTKKKIKDFQFKLRNIKSNQNIFSNKLILDNESTNRQSSFSPNSDRGKYYETPSSSLNININTINKCHRNNFQFEIKNSINKLKNISSLTSIYIKSDSFLINNNNNHHNLFINKENAIKISQTLRKKLINFRNIKTGQFNLPLLSENNNNNKN